MRLLPTLLNLPPQQTRVFFNLLIFKTFFLFEMNPALVHQLLQLPPLLVPLIQRRLLQMLLQMPQIELPKFGFISLFF